MKLNINFMESEYAIRVLPDDSDSSVSFHFDRFPISIGSMMTSKDARKLAGLLIYAADVAEGNTDDLEHLANEINQHQERIAA